MNLVLSDLTQRIAKLISEENRPVTYCPSPVIRFSVLVVVEVLEGRVAADVIGATKGLEGGAINSSKLNLGIIGEPVGRTHELGLGFLTVATP